MKKRLFKTALCAAAALSLCLGANASAEENMVKSYLTGESVPEEIGRNRPIAVMFNNIYDAVPQYGISKSGVLVEAEVEGLITRIMGIMEDYKDADRIGSIRSARNYYYYFAREFQAIYCHFGEAAYALPLLMLDSTVELSGLSERGEGDVVYYRSDDRVSPHNVFTNWQLVQNGIDYTGIDPKLPEAYYGHFLFADEGTSVTPDGITANVVQPGYPYNNATFNYNADEGLYYRSQYGEPQIDGNTGAQLTCKNIILQYCDSEPFDENGYLWTDVTTGGTGYYITNGKAEPITWSKPYAKEDTTFIVNIDSQYLSVPLYTGDFEVTHYYDMDGNEITLNPGQTWICLVRNSAADQVVISE